MATKKRKPKFVLLDPAKQFFMGVSKADAIKATQKRIASIGKKRVHKIRAL